MFPVRDQRLQLTLADYLVFAASLVISLAIGLYYSLNASRRREGNEGKEEEERIEDEATENGNEEKPVSTVLKKKMRPETTEDYLLGGRSMGVLPVAFSLMASFLSAITLIGVPAEVYMNSIDFVWINLSYILATPIAAYLYLPVFYRLRVTSVYEVVFFQLDVKICSNLFFCVAVLGEKI